jgi:hypothetical protein
MILLCLEHIILNLEKKSLSEKEFSLWEHFPSGHAFVFQVKHVFLFSPTFKHVPTFFYLGFTKRLCHLRFFLKVVNVSKTKKEAKLEKIVKQHAEKNKKLESSHEEVIFLYFSNLDWVIFFSSFSLPLSQ